MFKHHTLILYKLKGDSHGKGKKENGKETKYPKENHR